MTVGTTIYVAYLATDALYTFTTSEKTYEDYDVSAVEVLHATSGFTYVVDTGVPNASVSGAITVDYGDHWVQVTTSNGFNKWYRKTWETGKWWTKMGTWETFSGTTDSEGKLTITTKWYAPEQGMPDSGNITVGTTIYVAYKTA